MSFKNNSVLYTGVTNDLKRRISQNREKMVDSFTKKYNVTKLVYYESTADIQAAIKRENQIKGGSRQKKIDLVKINNPDWYDLYDEI